MTLWTQTLAVRIYFFKKICLERELNHPFSSLCYPCHLYIMILDPHKQRKVGSSTDQQNWTWSRHVVQSREPILSPGPWTFCLHLKVLQQVENQWRASSPMTCWLRRPLGLRFSFSDQRLDNGQAVLGGGLTSPTNTPSSPTGRAPFILSGSTAETRETLGALSQPKKPK